LNTPATPHATGIVVALAAEAAVLAAPRATKPGRLTPLADGAALWLSGMGPVAARRAAGMLADSGACALAVFGVAGALSPLLGNGALFCPEHVLDEEGNAYDTDPAWRSRLLRLLGDAGIPLHAQGALLGVAAPLLDRAAKTAAHQHGMALAVDMESAAVAAVARERRLPFVVLRAIVDEVDDTIPAALNDSVDAWGRPRPARLVAALCGHPGLVSELPRLYSRMRHATRTLRAAAKATGPDLGWQQH
jgi:nucleoside phosphorylase